jgi:hypothetical protein
MCLGLELGDFLSTIRNVLMGAMTMTDENTPLLLPHLHTSAAPVDGIHFQSCPNLISIEERTPMP